MRVVLTENLSDDAGRFLGLACMSESKSVHSEKHSSVNRLESVTHIRKRSRDNHRHGVIDISTPHLLVNVNLLDSSGLYFIFNILTHICLIYLF